MQLQLAPSPRAYPAALLDPAAEVVPGVVWGRPEWVPSAAFWASMVSRATEDDHGFVDRGVSLQSEVGFCLLGGFGITAEMNHAVHDRLVEEGCFEAGRLATSAQFEALLRRPVILDGRPRRYRFPRQRAQRLSAALGMLAEDSPPTDDALEFRRHLMRLPGVGPKTASWIARNWLGSDDVAILDIHVLRAGVLIGLFERGFRLPHDYERLEQRFLDFCRALGARPSLMDAVMWRAMRNIGRGSV